jgi:hypothetical protein
LINSRNQLAQRRLVTPASIIEDPSEHDTAHWRQPRDET